MKTIDYLGKRPKSFVITISLIVTSVLGMIDYVIKWEVYLLVFYLFPIFIVAWFAGRRSGMFVSVVTAGVWFLADFLAKHNYTNWIIPYWNLFEILCFFSFTAYIVSALKHALEYEKKLARTDYLTGVANIRSFFELAQLELDRSRRQLEPLTIAYMDIDNFKTVNDHFGHSTGDDLLQLVAQTIKCNIRNIDIVARLGGDEFAILLPGAEAKQAKLILNRVHRILSNLMKRKKWPATFSIGIVTYNSPPSSVNEIIRQADTLMYSIKNSGKNDMKQEIVEGAYNDN